MNLLTKKTLLIFASLMWLSTNAETESPYKLSTNQPATRQSPFGFWTGSCVFIGMQALDNALVKKFPERPYAPLGIISTCYLTIGAVTLANAITSAFTKKSNYKLTKRNVAGTIFNVAIYGLIPLYCSRKSATGDLIISTAKKTAEGVVNGACAFGDILVRNMTGP